MSRQQIIRTIIGLALVIILGVGGIMRRSYIEHPMLWGETMGTSYSITISGKIKRSELERLKLDIDSALVEVNRQMSTWDPQSEISQFNHSTNTASFAVSAGFATVVAQSLELSADTGGAFDPTLQPLLNLWGFGSEATGSKVPTEGDIEVAKKLTGWHKLEIMNGSSFKKAIPELSLNLGAIAKGYGVDVVGDLLAGNGYENWFVEIGGEVVARGTNPNGIPWRIGIQYPSTNPMDDRLQGIVHLSDGAVATSGDYRNYIETNGVVYTHILDPRTGRTVLSDTASVTVTGPDCMEADGIATALFVMGAEEGLAWVERHPGIEAMFLLRGGNDEITENFSSGFIEATSYSRP